ncbi:MAG: ATP-dependent DNA helicase RecQ [Akkermansiaceae bacterium]|nr:ATP-dependent DNA helicase RecQ [Akkermansiaceae bacterium]NNM28746.1 ATP-dependent DNA helicase RecQ [Akkermansiaceae bacterium]
MDPKGALRKFFGFEEFLDGQEEVVDRIVSGRDGLVVMPTGGGKSLCYQLPAMCLEGVTIVVSPLIALMKDQVDGLEAKGVAAAVINSTLTHAEQRERIARMRAGDYKLVYVAPERFRAEGFVSAMQDVKVALLAIDEAHCLSQWGHDFRPDYMRLGAARKALGNPQCVAFTATATPVVREDIMQVLALDNPFETVTGFERPNLSFNITPVESKGAKFKRLREVVDEHKTGIVYCATRKRVEEVAETLNSWGVKCIGYHGGMGEEEREATQNKFIRREVDVAVATNAFGMGIDRPDVRFVVHYEIPGSVEAYYQEAGRAGRDGEAAWCELLFNYGDTRTQEFFIEGANPGHGTICSIYELLHDLMDAQHEVHLGIDEIKESLGLKNGMAVGSALSTLVRHGYLERFDVPGQRRRGTRLTRPEWRAGQLDIDREALEEKERRDRAKLQAMVQMCYGAGCRQRAILEYFGEKDAAECGTCDVCRSDYGTEARELSAAEDEIVRKALAGVARMSRRTGDGWEGIFGRGRIVQMLTGSKSQDVLRVRLHELSTYGILRRKGTAFLNELFHAMHDAGLLVTQRGEYPLVTLTKRGEMVMKGESACRLVWPNGRSGDKDRVAELAAEAAGPFDGVLFSRLKELRNNLAQSDGVPAYAVFTNETLEAFTRLRPASVESGMKIKGVGPAKAEKYLPRFLEEIAACEGGRPAADPM